MKIKSPRATFGISATYPLCIAWGEHKKLAVGCSTGTVIIYDMVSTLSQNQTKNPIQSRGDILVSMLVLDAAISNVTWNGVYKSDKLVVTGYDGRAVFLDLDDPNITLVVMRSRNVMKSSAWASHAPCFVFTDNDFISRAFGISEDGSMRMAKYGETPGFCWQMAVSEHHGQFALGTSVGWVKSSNLYQVKLRALVIIIRHVCLFCL